MAVIQSILLVEVLKTERFWHQIPYKTRNCNNTKCSLTLEVKTKIQYGSNIVDVTLNFHSHSLTHSSTYTQREIIQVII